MLFYGFLMLRSSIPATVNDQGLQQFRHAKVFQRRSEIDRRLMAFAVGGQIKPWQALAHQRNVTERWLNVEFPRDAKPPAPAELGITASGDGAPTWVECPVPASSG